MIKEIVIKEDFIKLDSAMKYAGLIGTGGMAKNVILDGLVKVNGQVCTQRGKKLHENDIFEYNGNIVTVKK